MASPYPKPDSVNRVKKLEWTDIPTESGITPPALPDFRKWQAQTIEWWSSLWSRGQATQWDQSGETLWTFASLMDDMFAGRVETHRVSAEIRQHQDRHGLNPKAMLQLRWRFAELEPERQTSRPKSKRDRRATALKVISDDSA